MTASSTMTFDFSGYSVVVTGGTSGIGRATAEAFLRAGATVTVTGQAPTRAAYPDLPEAARYLPLVLNDAASIDNFCRQLDSVDVLVNNAGSTMPQACFHDAVQVNLLAVHEICSKLHERLCASRLPGGASIVNLASMMSYFGSPWFAGYGAAKAGIVQLTKSLAAGWASDGIRVNAVAPGSVPTSMTAKYADDPAIRKMVDDKTPMARWGKPSEMASCILFLSSTAASFVTGHTLVADGGYSVTD